MKTSPGTILAIMAHPDDAELWAGGTLALHARSSAVKILVETADPRRRSEAILGAGILGVSIEVVDALEAVVCRDVMTEFRPDIVITHRVDDVHPDHRLTALTVLGVLPDVVITTGFPKRVYVCDTYESATLNGFVSARVIVDVSETFDLKITALRAHQSQPISHFAAMAERMGASWGGRIGKQWAEAFDPVPVLGRLPSAPHL